MNKKFCLTIFVLLLSVLLFNSCKKTTQSSDKLDDVICPMEVGNSWFYEDSLWNPWNGRYQETIVEKVEINGSSKVIIDGGEYTGYYWTDSKRLKSIPSNSQLIVMNDNNGLWQLGKILSNESIFSKSLWLKFPVAVDDNWPYEIIEYDSINGFFIEETVMVKCISTNTIFETLTDKYNCIVYRYQKKNKSDAIYLYFVPNIGMVGRRYEIFQNRFYYKRRLISYSLE